MTSTLRTPPQLTDLGIDRVDWEDLGPAFIEKWGRPGGRFEPEHLTVYGKSGGGKSYFICHVCDARARARGSHVVIVATKRTDKTIAALGWPMVRKWPPNYGQHQVVYSVPASGLSAAHRGPQRIKVRALMDALWVPGSNVIVVWDELPYVETMLKLKPEMENFYREGRALGITNVAGMQRPSGVTRFAHSEPGWTVAFPPKDVDDRDRVAEVLGDRARFRVALDQLDRSKHEFLIRHDLTGESYVSHLPRPRRASVRSRTQ